MGTAILLVDDSNIFISLKNACGNSAVRFNFRAFEAICAKEDDIVEKHIAGSTPPISNTFWSHMENMGYVVHTFKRKVFSDGHSHEKCVDVILATECVHAIDRLKPDRVILLTGDGDFTNIASIRNRMQLEQGKAFTLDVWAFRHSLSSELKRVADNTFLIDDFQEKLVYLPKQDRVQKSSTLHDNRGETQNSISEKGNTPNTPLTNLNSTKSTSVVFSEKLTPPKKVITATTATSKVEKTFKQDRIVMSRTNPTKLTAVKHETVGNTGNSQNNHEWLETFLSFSIPAVAVAATFGIKLFTSLQKGK